MNKIKRLYRKIKKILSWVKFLWNNLHDWDDLFLFLTIKFKLQSMLDYHKAGKWIAVEDSNKIVKEITKALELLEIAMQDDFTEKEYEKLNKRYPRRRFSDQPAWMYHEKQREQHKKEFLSIMDLDNLRKNRAEREFFYYLQHHMHNWWE